MHFGILSSPVPGHLNPLCTIGRELVSRGHHVTLFSIPDTQTFIEKNGVNFAPIGVQQFGTGAFLREWGPIGRSTGFKGTIATIRLHVTIAAMMCAEVPMLAQRAGIESWIIDQIQFQGRAIANVTRCPFITVACALPVHRGQHARFPTPFVQWKGSSATFYTILRNRIAWYFFDLFSAPILDQGNKLLHEHGMQGIGSVEESFSPLLQIVPLPRSLDWKFNFKNPERICYVGSLAKPHAKERQWVPDSGDSRQIVYSSFGTIQNREEILFKRTATALARLPVHSIFGIGDWLGTQIPPRLAGSPTIMPFAPQCAVLKHASLCITHGGCNTAAEALSFGVPLLVLPITTDQFGVAARVAAAGAGLVLSHKASADAIHKTVAFMLATDRFHNRAAQLKTEIESIGGVRTAADCIESALARKANYP